MSVAAADQQDKAVFSRWASREAYGAAFAVAGEAIVVLQAFPSSTPAIWTLAAHIAVVASLALILFSGRSQGDDLTLSATILLIVLVAGPVGAAASFLTVPFVKKSQVRSPILRAWYKRLSLAGGVGPATVMHDRIAAGRVLRLDAAAPESFLNVIENGTLNERQTALGLMARKFHPDFAPALEAALRSSEPVVRVQAAAVVARVRSDLKIRIKALTVADDPENTAALDLLLARAGELYRLAGCTRVEESDRASSRDGGRRILEAVMSSQRALLKVCNLTDQDAAAALESFLLGSGRLKDFRVARRVKALGKRENYRIRLLDSPGAKSA